jgi:hypothetical protein
MKKFVLSFVASCLAFASILGCSSSTIIHSSDPETKIYVDGMNMGKGTVTYSDTKIVGSTTTVMLKKDGCEPQTFLFSRNEEFDAGACAGGVFLLVPFLWVEKYRPQHNFDFECDKKPSKSAQN